MQGNLKTHIRQVKPRASHSRNVDSAGVFSQCVKTNVFAEHVLVLRPRLFRGLLCLFVLSVVGRSARMLRTSQMLSREVQESMDTVLLGEEFVRYCEAHGTVHEKPRRRGAHRMDVDVSHRRNGQTATRVAPTHVKASATLTAKTRRATQWWQ